MINLSYLLFINGIFLSMHQIGVDENTKATLHQTTSQSTLLNSTNYSYFDWIILLLIITSCLFVYL